MSDSQIQTWVDQFLSWPVDAKNKALQALSRQSRFQQNAAFKTNDRFSVPIPMDDTQRQFAFQLRIHNFVDVEFIIEDYYATRMSINIDRWMDPIIREDRVKGHLVDRTDSQLVIEGTDPVEFRLVFDVLDGDIVKLNMDKTDYFHKIRRYKAYIDEWAPTMASAELHPIDLDKLTGTGHHSHGPRESACCV